MSYTSDTSDGKHRFVHALHMVRIYNIISSSIVAEEKQTQTPTHLAELQFSNYTSCCSY